MAEQEHSLTENIILRISFGGTLYEYIGKEEAIRLMEYVDDINVEFGGAGTKMYSTSGTHIKKLCMQNKLNLRMHLYVILEQISTMWYLRICMTKLKEKWSF